MISVTILTKNSQKYLYEVLTSVKDFEEVVLFDTGSTDNTLSIANEFPNVTIYQRNFRGFGPTHNDASGVARNDWVLSIDSDEVVTPEMFREIVGLKLDRDSVYSFPRNNYFNGKWIKWCGWYPDRQIRLYNKTKTRFTDAQVHEAIIAKDMQHIKLKSPFKHYSYEKISDFLTKMQLYSDLFAAQNKGKKTSSPWKAIQHGAFAFFKSYFLKRGFLGGYEGFVISEYNAHTAFYKYLKLYEANQEFKRKEK
jgi:glycosyltransferase involved in cell wall biosynthesis